MKFTYIQLIILTVLSMIGSTVRTEEIEVGKEDTEKVGYGSRPVIQQEKIESILTSEDQKPTASSNDISESENELGSQITIRPPESTTEQQVGQARLSKLLDRIKALIRSLLTRYSSSSALVRGAEELSSVLTTSLEKSVSNWQIDNVEELAESYIDLLDRVSQAEPTELDAYKAQFVATFDAANRLLSQEAAGSDAYKVAEGTLGTIADTIKELYGPETTVETLRNEISATSTEATSAETSLSEINRISTEEHIANAQEALDWTKRAVKKLASTNNPVNAVIRDESTKIITMLENNVLPRITSLDGKNTAEIKSLITSLVELSKQLLALENHTAGRPNAATKATDPDALIAQYQTAYTNLVAVNALVSKLPEELKTGAGSVGYELQASAISALKSAQKLLSQSTAPIFQNTVG